MGHDVSHVKVQYETVEDWEAWELGPEFWKRQKERDVETYHTTEVAAIWYEKKKFVKRAMDICDASVFIWCDAGCVRDDVSERAMKDFGLRNVPLDDGRLHVQHIRNQSYKPWYVYPAYRFAGAIIAGNRSAWTEFDALYQCVLHDYDKNEICTHSDQYIMASCQDRDPNLFCDHYPIPLDTINPWFFFLAKL